MENSCFPGVSVVKNPPANAVDRTQVLSLGWEDSPVEDNGNSLQYSYLGNPTDRGAWWTIVHGMAKELGTPSQLKNSNSIIIIGRIWSEKSNFSKTFIEYTKVTYRYNFYFCRKDFFFLDVDQFLVFIDFVTFLLLFYVLVFCLWSMWYLSSQDQRSHSHSLHWKAKS